MSRLTSRNCIGFGGCEPAIATAAATRIDDAIALQRLATPPSAAARLLVEREAARRRWCRCPTAELIVTRAAVQLDERAHDREAEAGAAVARAVRMRSRTSRTRLSCTSGGMPGPWSVTANTTASARRSATSVTVAPGGEKPTALASRLNSTCRTRRSSAMKLPMSGAARDVERDVVLDQAVLHALGRRDHGARGCRPARDRASSRRRRWWRGRGCC